MGGLEWRPDLIHRPSGSDEQQPDLIGIELAGSELRVTVGEASGSQQHREEEQGRIGHLLGEDLANGQQNSKLINGDQI